LQMELTKKRLRDKKIEIEVDPGARLWLAHRGYDPVFGARPLKRLIQSEIFDPLAMLLLKGTVKEGDKVLVTAGKDGIKIVKV